MMVAFSFAVLAATAVVAAPDGRLTAVRVAPAAGATEVVVQIEGGAPQWRDFVLPNPPRLVLDLEGVRSQLPSKRFEDVRRGGVVAVRTNQEGERVRVVIDLERPVRYEVRADAEGLRIRLATGTGSFEPWSSGAALVTPPPSERAVAVAQPRPPARRITVTFENADIRDVLATFAEFSGRSIVAGQGVANIPVNAEIRDQPWDVALATILRAYGLAYRELPSGIIEVNKIDVLRERESAEPLVTQTFRINYAPVQELAQTLQPMKTERGQIVANTSTNTLVVTDVESAVNRIASMIRQLDIRTPQVAIQAKIIFISRTAVEGLGVRYEIKDLRGNQLNRFLPGARVTGGQVEEVPIGTPVVLFGGSSVAAAGNAEAVVSSPTLEVLASFVAGRYNIFAFIQALQRTELADVQAHPLVTTLDNQQARILVGQRTPIRVVDLGAIGAPGGQAPRATAQLVETGIKLEVTPHITADRRILLQLQAENSDARPVAGEFGVVFDTQEGRTRLLVDDGETAVIGGLTVTRISETRQGIPLLMDIPILGALFRTTSRQEVKQDLLILVTPRIVES